MIENLPTRKIAATVAATVLLSGCASTGSGGSDADPCNLLVGAIIGGLSGALLDRNKRGRGAVIGAAAGAVACVAVNAVSRQTRTASQVEEDYKRANSGRLPPSDPVVQSYSINLDPGTRVRAGEKFQVVSNMVVVSGAAQPVTEVKETLALVSPDGKTRSAEKRANDRAGSGAYENRFTLTLPEGVSAGTYPIKTQLYVNGRQVGERAQNLSIVAGRDGALHLAVVE